MKETSAYGSNLLRQPLGYRQQSHRRKVTRNRLIDLGIALEQQQVTLLMSVTETDDRQYSVLAQLHPANGDRYLAPQITFSLLFETGELQQQVKTRAQDNYIQLAPFKRPVGTCFTIEIQFKGVCFSETFEL